MQTPAILYVHPRLRGAMTARHVRELDEAIEAIDGAIRRNAVSLKLPPRIAENRVEGYDAIPAWMIGASRANLSQMGR